MLWRICSGCRTISLNRKNNVWVHCGDGALHILPSVGTILDAKMVFDQSIDIMPNGNKPHGCIWFSRGGLSIHGYDYHQCNQSPPQITEKKSEIVITTHEPENIINIKTFTELKTFTKNYGTMISDQPTIAKKRAIRRIHDLLDGYSRKEVFDEMRHILVMIGIPYDRFVEIIHEICITSPYPIPLIAQKMTQHIPEIVAISIKSNHQMLDPSVYSNSDPVEVFLNYCHIFRYFYSFIWLEKLQTIPDTLIRDNTSIDWYRIQRDGYYGVSFDFRHIYDIVPQGIDYNRYDDSWHIGFDVESLCVFDTRALKNLSVELMEWKIDRYTDN